MYHGQSIWLVSDGISVTGGKIVACRDVVTCPGSQAVGEIGLCDCLMPGPASYPLGKPRRRGQVLELVI